MNISIDKGVKFQKYDGIGASGAWWAQIAGGVVCARAGAQKIRRPLPYAALKKALKTL